MTDITKCSGVGCPIKRTCYRYVASGDLHYQSYFTRVPYDSKNLKCEYYWSTKDRI